MTKTENWLAVGIVSIISIMALADLLYNDRRDGWHWHWDTGRKTHVIIHVQANPGVPLEKPRPDRRYKQCKGFFLERDGTRQDALIAQDVDEVSLDYLLPGETAQMTISQAQEGGKP